MLSPLTPVPSQVEAVGAGISSLLASMAFSPWKESHVRCVSRRQLQTLMASPQAMPGGSCWLKSLLEEKFVAQWPSRRGLQPPNLVMEGEEGGRELPCPPDSASFLHTLNTVEASAALRLLCIEMGAGEPMSVRTWPCMTHYLFFRPLVTKCS